MTYGRHLQTEEEVKVGLRRERETAICTVRVYSPKWLL